MGYLAVFAVGASVVLAALVVVAGWIAVVVELNTGDRIPSTHLWLFTRGALVPWLIGLAGGVLYEWWALARNERWLLKVLRADFVPKGDLIETKMALKDMAIAAGLPVAPALYVMNTSNVNAFAYKSPRRRPVLGVTRGLIEKLPVDQQRAVFANLVARIATADTLVSSAVVALMAPLQSYRAHRIRMLDEEDRIVAKLADSARNSFVVQTENGPMRVMEPVFAPVVFLIPFLFPIILVGEVFAAMQRKSQLTAAEKADAQGMLLLKDPQAMLSALERCVVANNSVVSAGETVADLFYCWTGDSTDDDGDPEWARVARLREVLGVEGHVPSD